MNEKFVKKELKSQLLNISRLRTYFLRGHSNWFAYVMSLLNFVTISFYLLIENLTIVSDNFKFRHYVLLFVVVYLPLAIIVGYFDMTRGTYRVEQKMAKELSPLWKEVFEKLDALGMKQNEIIDSITNAE
ncbi:MAG: hypothetical protein HeimC2_06710 [Candidatus Heimdallarchaeota archaeon LC_2]|nr:MAG: hypothetical protein HeimC2_06710 [Candidatus Heimdallarchaeota archaeon LC_2]